MIETGVLIFAVCSLLSSLMLCASVVILSVRIRDLKKRVALLEEFASVQEVNEEHIQRLEDLNEKRKNLPRPVVRPRLLHIQMMRDHGYSEKEIQRLISGDEEDG